MPRVRTLLVAAVAILLVTSAAAGDDAYDITLDQSVDIPERTLDTDAGEFTISTMGRYADDGTVEATTSGPENATYAIRLVDSEERLRQSAYTTGDGSAEFSLDRFPVGTYAIVITNESDAEDAKEAAPFVIYGYTVSQSTPGEVEEDSTLNVELSLTKVNRQVDEPPAGVEVALGNDSTSIRTDATRTSGLNYTAEIDVSSLSPGEYSLYTGVQRDNTVYGYKELIGVDTYPVSVTEATTPTPSPTETETTQESTGTESSQGAGAPAPAGTATDAATRTADGTTTATATGTSTPRTPSTATAASSPPSAVASTSASTSAPSQSSTESGASSGDAAATEGSAGASSSTTDATSTAAPSLTPVGLPIVPDGGVLVVCLGSFLLLYRFRGPE